MRLTITLLAVCSSGFSWVSNLTRNLLPRASATTKPGLVPPTLPPTTRIGSFGGPVEEAPRPASAGVTWRTPTRLVNQVESGTSSSALVFQAGSRLGSSSTRVRRPVAMTSVAYGSTKNSRSSGSGMSALSATDQTTFWSWNVPLVVAQPAQATANTSERAMARVIAGAPDCERTRSVPS